MSALTACQNAIARLVARRPASVFSSDDEICVEIASLATEAATDIAKACDWQALTRLNTITGDGATQNWPLPDDYDRMVNGLEIHSGNWAWSRYSGAEGLDNWLDLEAQFPVMQPGYWTIIANQMGFLPVISTGDTAKFYYVTNKWATSSTGTPKAAFDKDDDIFLLDDRLLTLDLIWRWKSMKGMDYQEDIRNRDIALSQSMSRDKGSRVIRKGGGYFGPGVSVAWPYELGGA